MPWKECSAMDERLRFVARLLDGEAMSEVCRVFGISRKTGYKIFERYKEHGLEALTDRSRRIWGKTTLARVIVIPNSRINHCRAVILRNPDLADVVPIC